MSKVGHIARVTLALIRLVNGTIGLVAPQIITKRLTPDEREAPPAAVYALRMFGIRTILVAFDLLRSGPRRTQAMRSAPLVHASDLVTAILIARSGRVPASAGLTISAISGFNTLLALIIWRQAGKASK